MSGGEFDYLQYRIDDCSINVFTTAKHYEKTCSKQTLSRMKKCAELLEKAGKMLHRVDYFVSSDDSEETFNEQWDAAELD